MLKEHNIISKLLEQKKAQALQESTPAPAPAVDPTPADPAKDGEKAMNEGAEDLVGNRYAVVDAIEAEGDSVDAGSTLVVKLVDDEGLLEIEVRNDEDEVVGILRASEDDFNKLIEQGSIEAEDGSDEEAEEDYEEEDGEEVDESFKVTDLSEDEELVETLKKVVRDGNVVMVPVRMKRKKRLSSAQKAALKKARKAAQLPGAQKARARSMKVRQRAGLGESEMMKELQGVLESYRLSVLHSDVEISEGVSNLEFVLDNSVKETIVVNLDRLANKLSESFGATVVIPDSEQVVFEGTDALVLNVLIKK